MSRTLRPTRSSRTRTIAPASTISLLVAAGLAAPAFAQPWHWNTDVGLWTTPGNWVQLAPPPETANVFIGNTPAAENGLVSLNTYAEIAGLTITNGMALYTHSHSLRVNGDTVISGTNLFPGGTLRRSALHVGATDGVSFRTARLTIQSGGQLNFDGNSGGYATVDDSASIGVNSLITGHGELGFYGHGTTLINNGSISPGPGSLLRMQQFGAGRFDLDGSSGDGQLDLSLYNAATNSGASLRLDGTGLSDSFGGRILMGARSDLHMNLTEGWVADASSEILSSLSNVVVLGGAFPDSRSVIRGGPIDFSGLLRAGFTGIEGHELALASSQITLRQAARIEVTAGSTLFVGGAATSGVLIEGGTFDVAHGGNLIFSAPTEIRGGVFSTAGSGSAEGFINFNGETQWRGNVTIDGMAHQSANATVAAPSVINATAFDMDGTSGDTIWNVNSSLVVNTQRIDDFSSRFDGTLNITAGLLGRLTLNLADPNESWQMNGTMNLAGSGGLPVTRVAGSHMQVTGNLNVTSGIAQITADTTFSHGSDSATITIDAGATLRMRGHTVVGSNTLFAGSGTLQNGVDGDLVLNSGVSLSQVGLVNNSLLRIAADAPGIASVDRFTSTATAVLGVDIGGIVAGTEHDLFLVTGGSAILDGVLNVGLLPIGGGSTFAPVIGDEFTILSALGGVSGVFSNDPFTQVGWLTYDWTIIYNPHTVVLRLDNIVPAPGSVALLGLGGLVAVRRRRSSGVLEPRRS